MFRLGISGVRAHKLRYAAYLPTNLMCHLCTAHVEDEIHYLFFCKALSDFQQKCIPRRYTEVHPSVDTLKRLFKDDSCLHDIGKFIYYSNKLRASLPHAQ